MTIIFIITICDLLLVRGILHSKFFNSLSSLVDFAEEYLTSFCDSSCSYSKNWRGEMAVSIFLGFRLIWGYLWFRAWHVRTCRDALALPLSRKIEIQIGESKINLICILFVKYSTFPQKMQFLLKKPFLPKNAIFFWIFGAFGAEQMGAT